MKSILIAVAMLAATGLALSTYFYGNLKGQILHSLLSQPIASTSSARISPQDSTKKSLSSSSSISINRESTGLASSTTPKFIPVGFKGPTSQPTIHGPSGPPPNY